MTPIDTVAPHTVYPQVRITILPNGYLVESTVPRSGKLDYAAAIEASRPKLIKAVKQLLVELEADDGD